MEGHIASIFPNFEQNTLRKNFYWQYCSPAGFPKIPIYLMTEPALVESGDRRNYFICAR
jgi:hypothetical protein